VTEALAMTRAETPASEIRADPTTACFSPRGVDGPAPVGHRQVHISGSSTSPHRVMRVDSGQSARRPEGIPLHFQDVGTRRSEGQKVARVGHIDRGPVGPTGVGSDSRVDDPLLSRIWA
jgi:hypothetical protein